MHMIGIVQACRHHGDAHLLLDSMPDRLPNGGGRVVVRPLLPRSVERLQVARRPAVKVTLLDQHIGTTLARVTSVPLIQSLVCNSGGLRAVILTGSMVLIGVAQIAIRMPHLL